MSILGAVIVPHPPLIIPTVGRGREQEVQSTIDAYRTVAKQVAAWEPAFSLRALRYFSIVGKNINFVNHGNFGEMIYNIKTI